MPDAISAQEVFNLSWEFFLHLASLFPVHSHWPPPSCPVLPLFLVLLLPSPRDMVSSQGRDTSRADIAPPSQHTQTGCIALLSTLP